MTAEMCVQITLALANIFYFIYIRVLELVDSANLSFVDESREGSSPSSDTCKQNT